MLPEGTGPVKNVENFKKLSHEAAAMCSAGDGLRADRGRHGEILPQEVLEVIAAGGWWRNGLHHKHLPPRKDVRPGV